MNRLPLAAACAFALFAAGAADAATTPKMTKSEQQTIQTPAKHGPVIDPDMQALNHNNLRHQLQANLQSQGYTSIKIMPSSFYVRAKDKRGDPVAMVIGPDSFTEVTEAKASAMNVQPKPQTQQRSTQNK